MEILTSRRAVLPTHWMTKLWASRSNIACEPRMDGVTLATSARPKA